MGILTASAMNECRLCKRELPYTCFDLIKTPHGLFWSDVCTDCEKDIFEQRKDIYAPQAGSEPDGKGFVYLIRCEQFYKIGVTRNPKQRNWSTDNPFDIEVIRMMPSSKMRRAEKFLHKKFVEYHHRGEWFILPSFIVDWFFMIEDIDNIILGKEL